MIRAEKITRGESLRDGISTATLVVVVRQEGLNAAQNSVLRRAVHACDSRFHVVKNRAMPFVLEGSKLDCLLPLFKGPSAIFFSNDNVAAAKVADALAKDNDKIVIVGGCMDGDLLDAQGIKTLASLPSLDEVRATIAGLLQRPAAMLATVLQAPASALVGVTAARGREEDSSH